MAWSRLTVVPARNDHTSNKLPDRGAKLRLNGSKPTGDQTMSFTPEYSDERCMEEGYATMNERTVAKDENHNSGYGPIAECCQDLGLNLKEPL